jgi:hypothetical protein
MGNSHKKAIMSIRHAYKTLELGYGSSMEEVKQGYKDLVRVWHPDRFAEDPRLRKKAEEKLKEINRAYGDLMAFFAHKTNMKTTAGLHPPPLWRGRNSWEIGGGAARVGRTIYRGICYGLNRIELRWICQILFDSGNRVGAATDAHVRSENPADKSGMHAGAERGRNDMDFRSVFDEVARQRGWRSKR